MNHMNQSMKKMAVTWVDKNESFFKRTHKKKWDRKEENIKNLSLGTEKNVKIEY